MGAPVEEGDPEDPNLMKAEDYEQHAADADQPLAVGGEEVERSGQRASSAERRTEGDEDEGEPENVGKRITHHDGPRGLL